MANETYIKLWSETTDETSDVVDFDLQHFPPPPETEKNAVLLNLTVLYVKYIQIFRKLDICYDQMVHPQKRQLVKSFLDSTMGRILEIKNEMVNISLTEFQYFDDILCDMKLIPKDLEMPIPKYFLLERSVELQERERTLDELLETLAIPSEEKLDSLPTMSLSDAVRLIQTHERARQGRLRSKIMKALKMQEARNKLRKGKPSLKPHQAAIIIQKIWRGYLTRRYVEKYREKEMIFLGMLLPPDSVRFPEGNNPLDIQEENAAKKRAIQEIHEYDYQDAVVKIKQKLLENEASDIQEAMQDKIREWIHDFMLVYDRAPEYPREEEGGSIPILDDSLTIEEMERREREREAKKDKKKESPKDKKSVKKENGEEVYVMPPSKFAPEIEASCKTYDEKWKTKDESDNLAQKYDEEMIFTENRLELQEEIRLNVDNLMRIELERLKDAMARDKGKKPGKKPGKKTGKGGKKGKKKEKDLTADRTTESLYEELVINGIIKKFSKYSISDYIGDYCYLGTFLQVNEKDVLPSLSDIRRLITEYCILPLGSSFLRENAPLVKSVLLVGPHGSGKTMLVHIVCSEAGANLFDLSAVNIVGKYPGKDGLRMLLHLVKKMGLLLQPSVVFIRDADKVFLKKVPKQDKALDPKRLKGVLPKFLKAITKEERILLIGTSSEPFGADIKALGKLYQKIIMVPKPDYASRYLMWKNFIHKFMGCDLPNVDIGALAKISDSYTAGSIHSACKQVLTDFRKALRHSKEIETREFITPLAKMLPVYKEEEDAFDSWYFKTPLGRRFVLAQENGEAV